MNSASTTADRSLFPETAQSSRPRLDSKISPVTVIVFIGLLAIGLLYTAYSLVGDVQEAGARPTTYVPYILLGVALLIALGFEFVNGFHDTANAVATCHLHALACQPHTSRWFIPAS